MSRDPRPELPSNWRWPFLCTGCGQPYPTQGFPYKCPTCGGLFDFAEPLPFAPGPRAQVARRGLARFRNSLPIPPEAPLISLGEGGTPLLEGKVGDLPVHFKCEQQNPTGSFKDRGAAVLVSCLAAGGVRHVVEDSSGNAGSALAAYTARAGIRAEIYAPATASGPKLAQMRACGAEVVTVAGPRSAATEAVRQRAEAGVVYASHACQPHELAGVATLAFEIVEQLGDAPGSVVSPAGQGSLLLGMHRGFEALRRAGIIERTPRLVGVQALACAPMWATHRGGAAGLRLVREAETLAEGIRILRPVRGEAVMAAVDASGGLWCAVDEDEIREGAEALARQGLYVEPTSAVVWPALLSVGGDLPQPIVAILTGSGFKAGIGSAGSR